MFCTNLIADGGPGWLNLLVLLLIWNAMKLIIMGPVSLVLLVRVREAAERRLSCAEQANTDESAEVGELTIGMRRWQS